MTRATAVGNPTLQEAFRLPDAGISFIPTAVNKLPAGWCLPRRPDDETKHTWDPYKERLPTHDEAIQWFGGGRRKHGIARIHGRVSGNLETLDFDVDQERIGLEHDAVVAEWEGLVEELQPGLLFRLTKIRTPRPGTHYCYRCEEPVEGNQKIAHAAELDPEMRQPVRDSGGEIKWKCFIESRGEGGYACGPGTPASLHQQNREYEHVGGPPLHEVQTITAAERLILLNTARMLTRKASEDEPHRRETNGHAGERPGDDFNARTTWDELLRERGWAKVSECGGVGKWKRPGGTSQWSATTNYGGHDLLHVFSTGLPIPAERSYNRFQFLTYMDHGGDFSAATKALAAKGYGKQPAGHTTTGQPPKSHDATRSYKRTDLGNAERFCDDHRGVVRYCHPWGRWLVWDGKRNLQDDTGAVVRLAKGTVRGMWSELQYTEDEKRKALSQHLVRSESSARINALLALAQSEPGIPVLPAELDRDPWLFNCENGTLDLRTGELRTHRRTDLITKLCPTRCNPDAASYAWDRFIEDVFCDVDLIAYVQRLLGYCLTGAVHEHVVAIFWGCGGNGKSTLLNAYMETVGPDYAMKAVPDLLLAKKNESHPTERADLFGKRFVACVETGEGRRLNEALLKELSGGDPIRARRMREDFWQFDPTHKAVLCTNHRPRVKGTDHAIWRRLQLVPFTQVFDGRRKDKSLPEKLRAEAEGILAWCVRGCLEWQRIGLAPPLTVQAATAEYRDSEDAVQAFIAECCILSEQVQARASDLFARYKSWAATVGESAVSQRKFGEALTGKGFKKRTSNGVWYTGIGLLA